MPSHSVKQAKVMSALAHGWHPSKGSVAKIPLKVAKEFHAADAGHKYGKKHRAGGAIKSALRTAHGYKRKAEGGEVDDAPVPTPAEPKKVYIYPNLAEDLNRKTPLEGREPIGPEMSAAPQTPRDTIANWLRGPDTKSYEPRAVLADKAMHVLDATPPMAALEAGQDIGKGNYQSAAMSFLPAVKKAQPFTNALMHAADTAMADSKIGDIVFKKLKAQYPKDIATASVENDLSPEQIDNLKTYMTPGAQKAFEKHYYKIAPKKEPTFEPSPQSKIVGDKQVWSDPAWEKNFKENYQHDPEELATLNQNPPDPKSHLGSNFGPEVNMRMMTKVGDKLGTNEGGVYKGTSGNKYYIKQGQSPDHVKNELIASSLYDAAGVNTLKYRPVQGGNHIATEWANKEKDNAYKFTPAEKAKAQQDFAVHAWLANHDVVGTGGDNLGLVGGKPTVLDTGGSLAYRAQGAPKGKAFGNTVDELDSMRGLTPGIKAPDAAKMFGDMSFTQLQDSAMRVVSIPDQKIKAIVAAHGGDSALADKLIARKQDMAERLDLELFDPNYIEKHITAKGDDYENTLREVEEAFYGKKKEPFKPKGEDTDIEDYYAHQEKHEAGPEWEPDPYEYQSPHTKLTPADVKAAPYKQFMHSKISETEYVQKFKEAFRPSDWSEFTPKDVPAEKVKKLDFGANKPEDLEKLGFNTKTPIYKGGFSHYPEQLIDPKTHKNSEQAFFAATHPGIASVYGDLGQPYIARAPKFYEFDWDKFFGSNHYASGDMHRLIQQARELGADVVAIHNMHDSGSQTHGLHTQLAFLNTHVLRAPTAKFDPNKLHLRYPLAGLAGGGIFTYGALKGEGDNDHMKRGGKVKEKDPEEHEFIDFKRGGLIDSDIPGRTDKIPMKVTPGSYVLPADIPSALGQGNTKAGSEVLSKMFTSGPYGLKPMTQKAQAPHFDRFRKFADGGVADDHVPIVAAGGEFIIHPDMVKEVGHGDIAKGHKVLDKFVLHTRAQHIKTLKGLKGPKK